jgi:hypothetical protein
LAEARAEGALSPDFSGPWRPVTFSVLPVLAGSSPEKASDDADILGVAGILPSLAISEPRCTALPSVDMARECPTLFRVSTIVEPQRSEERSAAVCDGSIEGWNHQLLGIRRHVRDNPISPQLALREFCRRFEFDENRSPTVGKALQGWVWAVDCCHEVVTSIRCNDAKIKNFPELKHCRNFGPVNPHAPKFRSLPVALTR